MNQRKKRNVFVTVPRGTPLSEVKKLIRNPVLLSEDEADYQLSMVAIREGRGKAIPLETILKRYGRQWKKKRF